MAKYPLGKVAREKARREAEERWMETYHRKGLNMSIKCSRSAWGGRHKGTPDGCTNDGTGCLCECHDG